MSDLQQEWTDKIVAWRSSGLSMAAWCRQNDESYDRSRLFQVFLLGIVSEINVTIGCCTV